MVLNRGANPPDRVDRRRRNFLIRFCQGAGASLIPTRLWGGSNPLYEIQIDKPVSLSGDERFYLQPHYRSDRPLDALLHKVDAAQDVFINEQYADRISGTLSRWSESLRRSPSGVEVVRRNLSPNFQGGSQRPIESRLVSSNSFLQVRRNKFSEKTNLKSDDFLREWQAGFDRFSKIETAEFQITSIGHQDGASPEKPQILRTQIHYEIVGSGQGFYREQRVGSWQLNWEASNRGEFYVTNWETLEETQARSSTAVYVDVTAAALGHNSSYAAQILHGTDYWRTVLDGACGIDIYGHNGVSVADIDSDGFDDLYICQPAGLPNRLYRNRGDGSFEDITESSGLGILENTPCALFADFDNDGRQDVILVRTNGPLLFLNQGGGKFRQRTDAFQFANPPQGTFTGASVADYDRDGWLDIYFCLYSYYQGTGQYRYPSPYHDAENGPPNFLMRNNRDGSFKDVTASARLDTNNTRYSFCCGWNDYDGDGWPDLYVVNDFGRKNLYRNNRDGTFEDVAAQAGAEDVGAGMSVAWLDYDNDGVSDLYVGDMWTAAGVRLSMQENFKNNSAPEIRALYQKHAMGNSLLRNRGPRFQDVTAGAGVGMGRWAWSSDAFDFDHDGFPDLYITNGMVSGPSRSDLNSFFWRQVVANSPDAAGASHDYEQGWNAINELIRADGTWSGYERNVFYANDRDGRFSDVSAAVGLDFVEDGRSFALFDFDHDGRLELVGKNRNAPQVRLLKNVVADLPPSIAFRLRGTKSNRDAIGAFVTIETSDGRQTKSLQAGSGFLSQHSKDIFFGLGEAGDVVKASIRWPSGLAQELRDLPSNHRVWIEEGSAPSRLEAYTSKPPASVTQALDEVLPDNIETWLLSPVAAPAFSLNDLTRKPIDLSGFLGKMVLLNFWTTKSAGCRNNLKIFQESYSRWAANDLHLIAMNVDALAGSSGAAASPAPNLDQYVREKKYFFPVVSAPDDVAAIYNICYRQLFDRHRDMPLPTSFLIDTAGNIVKVYQGEIVAEHVESDLRSVPRTDDERLNRGLPFPSSTHRLEFGRNHLSLGTSYYQHGYLDQAVVPFRQALRDNPASAEALYGIGSVYLNQNKNAAAREAFERCVNLQSNYPDTLPDAWNNLGVLATRDGQIEQSIELFQQALQLSPRHLLSLDNLGNAYRLLKRWDDAKKVLALALEISPSDPEANYSLGMVFAQTDEADQAYQYLERALKARPDYPEALNNLGVLFLVTKRRDQAVDSFKHCIRVAPDFDQAYLNLARVYALEGANDESRGILMELLKHKPDDVPAKQMLQQLP